MIRLMQDPADVELQKTAPPPMPLPRGPSPAPWIAAAIAVALAAGVYFYLQRGGTPAPSVPPPDSAPQAAVSPDRPLGAAADPIEIPPLDASDDVVRMLVAALSSHPRVAAWLATDDLMRNFTVVVENIAGGKSPATHLRSLRPAGAFRAATRGTRLFVDPRSYDRYSGIADAVASIDPAGAARLYTTLRPRIQEAYRELGHDEPFDRALEQALVALLRVPIGEDDVELEPQGAIYEFADARLEQMTAAQKQLARMGPRNARTIQARLREIALALGIPPERLPA